MTANECLKLRWTSNVRLKDLKLEASKVEWSTKDSSSIVKVFVTSESESKSSLEVVGVVLGNIISIEEDREECLNDERIVEMLAKDLPKKLQSSKKYD